jgi:hypothetical protein
MGLGHDSHYLIPYAKLNRNLYMRMLKIERDDNYLANKLMLSNDFSIFDMCINEKYLNIIFEEMIEIFDPILRPYVRNDLNRIADFFIRTNILLPNALVYTKEHGIPSGSYFTNIVGSLFNMTLTQLVCQNANINLGSNSMFMGDDGLVSLEFRDSFNMDREERINWFSKLYLECGMLINSDKSLVGKNFLSRN